MLAQLPGFASGEQVDDVQWLGDAANPARRPHHGRGMHFFDHKIKTLFFCDQNLLLKFSKTTTGHDQTTVLKRILGAERATGA